MAHAMDIWESARLVCLLRIVILQAPYLRFSDKQIRRLFHKVREALERTGKVRRVRAFCKQTVRYERCLLYSNAEELHPGATGDALQGAGGIRAKKDAAGDMM